MLNGVRKNFKIVLLKKIIRDILCILEFDNLAIYYNKTANTAKQLSTVFDCRFWIVGIKAYFIAPLVNAYIY